MWAHRARHRFGHACVIGNEALKAAHQTSQNVAGAAKIYDFGIAGRDMDRAAPDGNSKQRFQQFGIDSKLKDVLALDLARKLGVFGLKAHHA